MKKKYQARLIRVTFGIALVISTMASLTQAAFGAATDDGGYDGNNGCQTSGTGKWWDTCHGASWVRYPVNNNNNIKIDKRGSVKGGYLKGCVDDGAEYYYRLGLQVFDRSTGKPLAEQAGLVPASKVGDSYWPVDTELKSVWGGDDDHVIDSNKAAVYFGLTQNLNMNSGLSWDNVSAFCWSEKAKCQPGDPYYPTCVPPTPSSSSGAEGDAHFFATSHVQVVNSESGLPYYSLDPSVQKNTVSSVPEDKNARISFSTDNASVKLIFWHNIDYVTTGATISLPSNLDGLVDYPAFFPSVNKSDFNYDLDAQGQKVYKPDGQYFDAEAYLKAVDDKLKELATTNGVFSQSAYDDLINAIKTNLAKGKTYQDGDDYFTVNVSTGWDIDNGSGTTFVAKLGSNNPITSGIYTRSKSQEPKKSATSGDLAKTEVTVDLNPGDTKLVCQRIHYTKKNFVYKAEEVTKDVDNGDGTTHEEHDYWNWSIKDSSGEGYSEACVEVHRAEDAGNDFNLATGSKVETTNPYAGETAYVVWGAFGQSNPMLRMMGRDASVYLTNESVGQHTNGYKRSASAPCGYYSGLYGASNLYYCHTYDSKAVAYPNYIKGVDRIYSKTETFVAPDHTASKLCATFGFNYGRYYNFSGNYTGSYPDTSWRSAGSYWRVYNSSCRTIAKKPSVAIWNGSLMTPGGVKTSLSPRYDTRAMNDNGTPNGNDELIPTSSGGSRTLYGSWSEHLDVIGKKDEGHTSGSTLYKGNATSITFCPDNVNLTIANANGCGAGQLGFSQIPNNSAYQTKLNTYLRDNTRFSSNPSDGAVVHRYTETNSSDVMARLGENMTGTTIIKYTGTETLEISKDITYSTNGTNGYSNIYQLPQVIIFTDGNINITSDVTRIDAWLIVGGTIDTCSNKPNIYAGTQNNSPTDDPHSAAATVYGISGVQTCSKQLVFNGPVLANGLKLNRTFGSDPLASNDKGNNYNATFTTNGSDKSTKEAPAEIFNLRADTYLWAYAQAGRYDSSYTESYSRELPPRY